MEGEMWDRRVPSATELGDLAEVWPRLHQFQTDGLWMCTGQARPWLEVVAGLRTALEAYARWANRSSSQCRAAARLCLEALERCITAAAPLTASDTAPLCFCRSDACFANVIARPDGRPGLVDWEDSGLRDPARGVVDLLAGYLALFPVFWLGILLADAMRRIPAGELETWMINEMEPNTRLRRYLARAQAWPDPDPNAELAGLGDLEFF
jgi:Phosphotransferase enzyme family